MAIRTTMTGVKSGTMFNIDPRNILVATGYNIREFNAKTDPADATLKASIKAVGLELPITVREADGKIYVVSGHRRLAAIKELIAEGAAFRTIPCVPEDKARTDQERTLALWTSNDGKPLSQLEKAGIILRLRAYGWKDSEIADKVGVTARAVLDMANLGKSDPAVKKMVRDGKISATLATAVLAQAGKDAPAVLEAAAKDAESKGKAKVTAPNVAQALKATTGKALTGQKVAASKAAPAPAPVAKAANPAKLASQQVPNVPTSLAGPFTARKDAIHDAKGQDVATCVSPVVASALVHLLNIGFGVATGQGSAAPKAAPPAPPAPSKPVPVPPAPMASHGKAKAAKAAKAAPVARAAPASKGKAAPAPAQARLV